MRKHEHRTAPDVKINRDTSCVHIDNLRIVDPELCNSLVPLTEEERGDFIKRALCVGNVVLQNMDTTTRVDYVHGEFERMQHIFKTELTKTFSDEGHLPRELDKFFGEDGILQRTLQEHFGEQGSTIYRILNPKDETTPLGNFRKQLLSELDIDREGTAFYKLSKTMDEGFEKILISMGALKATEEEREKSTAKGRDFQTYVYETIDSMARDFEDTVSFVANEEGLLGKVGDVLVSLNPRDTGNTERKIVVEAKNASITMSGKNSILKELEKAKENRGAQYAIAAIHESEIPTACGCFRRYHSENILCSVPEDDYPLALEVAYKVARAELVLSTIRETATMDISQLKGKVIEILGHLETIKAIKRALSGAKGKIDDAKNDLENMEDSIREILSEIQGMVKASIES